MTKPARAGHAFICADARFEQCQTDFSNYYCRRAKLFGLFSVFGVGSNVDLAGSNFESLFLRFGTFQNSFDMHYFGSPYDFSQKYQYLVI